MVRLSTVALATAGVLSPSTWLAAAITTDEIPSDLPVSQLLTTAQTHLARGETNDALVYYDAAIARDPKDYMTHFKRATTYLSAGRLSHATEDYNKVLELRPGFEGAHLQLAKIKQRSADWDGALKDYKAAGKTAGQSREVDELLEAMGAAELAEAAAKEKNWDDCVQNAGVAILVANRHLALRELRASCRFNKGEVEEGVSDLHHIANLRPGDVTPWVKMSAIAFYALGDTKDGLTHIRKCLHSDPENKVCKKLLKQEKAINKVLEKVDKAFSKKQPMTGTKMLIQNKEDPGLINDIKEEVETLRKDGIIPSKAPNALLTRVVELACQGYYDMNSKKAQEYCEEAIKLNEDSVYGLLYKAKTQEEAEDYEAAIRTLEKASELAPERRDLIQELLQKARIELKRSKTKDYYKVLGVARDADERQIKSAYRKLSKLHHPDKAHKSGLTKEESEKKMASINEAYEVLSNPELRARFDRGDDPNSQEQQGNPFHGNPFGQQFMFQQGGGAGGQQQFKFQFGSGGGFPGGFPFG
ncbi:hypothetical protein MCOR03_003173 [Pyricularia oryzae]|nr:hypothetical protein MCOR24_001979 [Pyricularia oryzae]KAI6562915.1 hypothetical protein MCOR03_003173 [Pyricularia oryzae]